MYNRLKSSVKQQKKELTLEPSIADSHIGLRTHLGDNVFYLENGDVGIVYALEGVYDEPLTEDELATTIQPYQKFIQSLIKGVPSHKNDSTVVIQIICSQGVFVEDIQDNIELGLTESIIRNEERHLLKSGLIKRDLFLSVRWSPTVKSKDYKKNLYEAKNLFLQELKSKEIEANINLRSLTSQELLSYYNKVLNRGEPVFWNLGDEDVSSLHENIINQEATGTPNGLDFKNGNIRVFCSSELPATFALGKFRLFLDNIPVKKYELVLTLSHGSSQQGSEFLLKKMFYATGPSHRKKFEDLLTFEQDLANVNPRVCMSLKLVTYDLDKTQESQLLSTAVDFIGVPMVLENHIGVHMICTSLPLNCSADENKIIGRSRTVLLNKALAFAPIYTSANSYKGYRIWVSRSGVPMGFDLFKGGGNNHLCVLGNSESGKSCLNAQMIIEFMARFPSGLVRIIDKKTSYTKLCDLFEGQVIHFNESFLKENPYSPFASSQWDDDEVASTVVFLQNAIEQLDPSSAITGLHSEILSEAIKMAFNDFEANEKDQDLVCDPHFTWIDIKKKLPTAAERKGTNLAEAALADIQKWTVSFDHTGQLGFLFSKHEKGNQKSADKKLLCYDLDGISDPRLQVIAAQLAFLKISRELQTVDKSIPKLIIFEELGVVLQGDSEKTGQIATRFVRNVVKTARKLEAMAVGISNELTDFTDTEGGKAFWSIATQKLFLPQSPTTKKEIAHKLKELTLADVDVICDLHIEKGLYSQAYLISQTTNFKGSFLIPLSPSMDTLVTTKGKQATLYEQLREDGLNVNAALDYMITKHPYGKDL